MSATGLYFDTATKVGSRSRLPAVCCTLDLISASCCWISADLAGEVDASVEDILGRSLLSDIRRNGVAFPVPTAPCPGGHQIRRERQFHLAAFHPVHFLASFPQCVSWQLSLLRIRVSKEYKCARMHHVLRPFAPPPPDPLEDGSPAAFNCCHQNL